MGIWAQTEDLQENTRAIEFPDIPGYVTLKCDLHMHTVLSDGNVWPNIRVQEAIRDGLDVISITDHIEYQPHKKDIPHPDRNRSYELALEAAEGTELLIIPGTEITRMMPPGHFNAIFVKDVNTLNEKDVMEVFREALELAQKYNLTLLGNSDIHGLVDWSYGIPEGGHRPVTLVFAEEKSAEAMQKAMENRQTAVWFKNTLVGNQVFLTPMIEESLEIIHKSKGLVPSLQIHNHSDADYILENISAYSLHNFAPVLVLKAHEITTVQVKTLETLESFELKFKVLNAYSEGDEHPEIKLLVE